MHACATQNKMDFFTFVGILLFVACGLGFFAAFLVNGPLADSIENIDTEGTNLGGGSLNYDVSKPNGVTRYAFRLQNGTNYEALNNVYVHAFSTALSLGNTGRVSNGPITTSSSNANSITIAKATGAFNPGTVYIVTFSEKVTTFRVSIND